MEFEELKYLGDDITFCMADCQTDCRRKPKYIRLKDRLHSYADFSATCGAYEPQDELHAECDTCRYRDDVKAWNRGLCDNCKDGSNYKS